MLTPTVNDKSPTSDLFAAIREYTHFSKSVIMCGENWSETANTVQMNAIQATSILEQRMKSLSSAQHR